MNRTISFVYCPRCGQVLEDKTNKNFMVCKKCNFHYFFNPSPTNALIISNSKQEILLVKKKIPPKTGQWDLPGGFVELGETIEDSLEREIKEELGLTLKKYRYFRSFVGNYLFKGTTYQPLCFVFYTTLTDEQINKIRPGDDAESFRFFRKNKLPWDKILFIDVKKALRAYLLSSH